MAWLAMSLRRLRQDRAATIGLFTLVGITAFVFAIGPRLLSQVTDRALRDEVAAAPAAVRDIQLIQERRIGPAVGDPMGAVDAAGAELGGRIPPAISDLFVDAMARDRERGAIERLWFPDGSTPPWETTTS